MPLYELAALGAALCWAFAPVLSAGPVYALGPFWFNLLRQLMVTVVLGAIVLVTGRWQGAQTDQIVTLALSGLVGVFVGDTLLFFGVQRLGPRRNGTLFAMNAPIAAILGWAFLGEGLKPLAVAGIAACAAGVALVVLGRPGRSGSHRFEAIRGPVWQGVAFGLLAATGQALGSLIARPVMAEGFDPFTASLIRVSVGVTGLAFLMSMRLRFTRIQGAITAPILSQIFVSGLAAMVIGMTLLMFALQGGKVGIISTLSATSPVLILPIMWVLTRARPSATSWAGAILTVAGLSLIFLR